MFDLAASLHKIISRDVNWNNCKKRRVSSYTTELFSECIKPYSVFRAYWHFESNWFYICYFGVINWKNVIFKILVHKWTNIKVKLAKTGYGPHSSTLFLVCIVQLLYVLFCVLFVCKCLLPPGCNPIAVNKYIISYQIFRTCPDRPWDPPRLLYNGYRVFPGGKERPGRDADPSPPSSALVMKE